MFTTLLEIFPLVNISMRPYGKHRSFEAKNFIQKICILDSVSELQINALIYYGDSLCFSKQIILLIKLKSRCILL